jgi:hypothetical protein
MRFHKYHIQTCIYSSAIAGYFKTLQRHSTEFMPTSLKRPKTGGMHEENGA